MVEVALACPGHCEFATPIIGKLRLHLQGYMDSEEFLIMPLERVVIYCWAYLGTIGFMLWWMYIIGSSHCYIGERLMFLMIS